MLILQLKVQSFIWKNGVCYVGVLVDLDLSEICVGPNWKIILCFKWRGISLFNDQCLFFCLIAVIIIILFTALFLLEGNIVPDLQFVQFLTVFTIISTFKFISSFRAKTLQSTGSAFSCLTTEHSSSTMWPPGITLACHFIILLLHFQNVQKDWIINSVKFATDWILSGVSYSDPAGKNYPQNEKK